MGKPYNGHRNRNHWNVSLWIGGDEGLYRLALDCIKHAKTRGEAVAMFLEAVGGEGAKTPDGSPYSVSAVRAAMVGLT